MKSLYLWEKGGAYDIAASHGLTSDLLLIRNFLSLSKGQFCTFQNAQASFDGDTKCTWHSLLILLRKTKHSGKTGRGW